MTYQTQPAIFVGHGSPMIMFEPSPAREFLSSLASMGPRPDAIILISAHHDMPGAVVTSVERPETIHDFGGFPQALFDLQYPAKGDPLLAKEIADLLSNAGFPTAIDPMRGLDHGAWVPLMLAWPDADVPIVQLSISSEHAPDWHYRLGQVLAPLRARNILIIGSGSLTHNLRAVFVERRTHDAEIPAWAAAFNDWMKDRFDAGDTEAILNAVEIAPYGRENHPTMDHILPLFAAMGAGGPVAMAERLHHSYTYGVLSMDAYAFA